MQNTLALLHIEKNKETTMNIELLDLYKVYSLEKMSALSKQNLAMQYEQCGQIAALRKQMAASDSTNRRILENQIKELERQEKVRYYKSLIFNLQEVVKFIKSIDDVAFRFYVSLHFCEVIECLAKECLDGLEEIADKSFASEVINNNANVLQECQDHKKEFLSSVWNEFEESNKKLLNDSSSKSVRDCKFQITQIDKEINSLQEECSPIFSFFMSSSKKKALQQAISAKKDRKNELTNQIDKFLAEQSVAQENVSKSYNKVTNVRPNWEKEIEEISNYLPKRQPIRVLAGKNIDSLFAEAAKNIVESRVGSTSNLQRKFEIGFHRAESIMAQLEEAGIVGPDKGKNSRDVIVVDESDLNEILKSFGL